MGKPQSVLNKEEKHYTPLLCALILTFLCLINRSQDLIKLTPEESLWEFISGLGK